MASVVPGIPHSGTSSKTSGWRRILSKCGQHPTFVRNFLNKKKSGDITIGVLGLSHIVTLNNSQDKFKNSKKEGPWFDKNGGSTMNRS